MSNDVFQKYQNLLKEMTLNEEQIQEFEIPLDELCIVELSGNSFGPLWLSDITEQLVGLKETELEAFRYRKFGTENWTKLIDLFNQAENAPSPSETLQEIVLQDDIQIEEEHDVDVLSSEASTPEMMEQASGKLPSRPPELIFSQSKEEVLHALANQPPQETSLQGIVQLVSPKVKNHYHEEKEQDNSTQDEWQNENHESIWKKTSFKIAATSLTAASLLLAVYLGLQSPKIDSDSRSRLPASDQIENSRKNLPAFQSKGHAPRPVNNEIKKTTPTNTNTPSFKRNRSSSNPLRNTRSPASRNTFRDSKAYERNDDFPQDVPESFPSEEPQMASEGFEYDDGSTPVEQDPLRRKLSNRTTNPDGSEMERSPASNQDVSIDEDAGHATVDVYNE